MSPVMVQKYVIKQIWKIGSNIEGKKKAVTDVYIAVQSYLDSTRLDNVQI